MSLKNLQEIFSEQKTSTLNLNNTTLPTLLRLIMMFKEVCRYGLFLLNSAISIVRRSAFIKQTHEIIRKLISGTLISASLGDLIHFAMPLKTCFHPLVAGIPITSNSPERLCYSMDNKTGE